MKKITAVLLIFILIIIFASGCRVGPGPEEYITIGALLPLTGDYSDDGIRAFNGLHLAKIEINANGGILGRKIDIIILDDKGDREEIVRQYHVLKEKGVAAIIGSLYSDATSALAEAAAKDGIPVISPTASDPDITMGRDNIFRAIFVDDQQACVMSYFARNSLGAETAVVMRNENNGNFGRLTAAFAEVFTGYGGRVISAEVYSSEEEFAAILAKHADDPPDVIFCPEDYIPAAALVNAVYEAGFGGTTVLGTDAWDGILAYIVNPEAMRNAYYTSSFSFDDPDIAVAQFVRDYLSVFAQMPLASSAGAYMCVLLLAEAIEKAGSTNSGDITAVMRESEFETMAGRIGFDENNNPRPNIYIIQIENGVYSMREKIRADRGDGH
jgi:branched-chain amino acid transport system substrate-binding protein